MSCKYAVYEKNKRTNTYYLRPCGSCMFCRINNRTGLEFRIFQEVMTEYHKGNYSTFATLTYNDNFVPITEKGNQTISKTDIDNYIQKFKYNSKKLFGRTYKQFLVTEYGDSFGRPHAHSIIMGLDPCKRNLISSAWLRGHVMALPVLSGGIRYCLKYMDKQIFGDQIKEVFQERTPPFTKISNEVGLDWIKENAEDLIANQGYQYKGHWFPLSHYMKQYLSTLDQEILYKHGLPDNRKIKEISDNFEIPYKKADYYNSIQQELKLLKNALMRDCVADHDKINELELELNIMTPKQKPSFNVQKLALEALGA